MLIWEEHHILELIAEAFAAECAALDLEQAVYGLDARDELALHPLIAGGLGARAAYRVHREQRYPSDRHRKKRLSSGERCDIVLTPSDSDLAAPEAEQTLFEDPDACALSDAFWLEVKVAHQFQDGRPRRDYGSRLLQPARKDVLKLAKEPGIASAGVLLVLFSADDATATHDLDRVEQSLADRALPLRSSVRAVLPMTERQGHSVCALRLLPVIA